MCRLLPAGEKSFFLGKLNMSLEKERETSGLWCFLTHVAHIIYGSRTGPTCELLLLLDGVDGTESSGSSETSLLVKNSKRWTLAKE